MFAIRMNLGDPDFVNITNTIYDMLSSSYAKEIQQKILDNNTFSPDYYKYSRTDGNAVSMTTTVNYGFGDEILSPLTGIVLNNEIDDFSTPTEVSPDRLPPAHSNLIKPTLIFHDPIVTKDNQVAGVIGGRLAVVVCRKFWQWSKFLLIISSWGWILW